MPFDVIKFLSTAMKFKTFSQGPLNYTIVQKCPKTESSAYFYKIESPILSVWLEEGKFQFHLHLMKSCRAVPISSGSISSTLCERLYLYESTFQSFSQITVWLWIFLAKESQRKSCSYNIDKMDYRGQFYQHSMKCFISCRIQKRKDCQVISVFLHFWGLRAQILLVKHWWNWLQVSISSTFYEELLSQQIYADLFGTQCREVVLNRGAASH